jgi:hypothetical protein
MYYEDREVRANHHKIKQESRISPLPLRELLREIYKSNSQIYPQKDKKQPETAKIPIKTTTEMWILGQKIKK